jgi:hypothetical protein
MSSKLNNYPPLLEYLFNLGRQTGDAWIAQYGEQLLHVHSGVMTERIIAKSGTSCFLCAPFHARPISDAVVYTVVVSHRARPPQLCRRAARGLLI